MGNPEELTVVDVAKLILAITGGKSRIVHRELPPDDPKVRRPDISLARRVLGWEPKIGPEEGLRKTLPYFAAQLERGST